MASNRPQLAREVPEVYRRIVGDDERLTIYLLVVERCNGQLRRRQEQVCGEEMCVSHVANVCEVEEIRVIADLEVGLVVVVQVQHVGQHLNVAFAKDTRGADGGGEEVGGAGAICLQDGLFGQALRLGVVVGLVLASEHGPALVGIDEVGDRVADDRGGAGVDERSDASLLAGVNDALGAFDVDFVEEGIGHLGDGHWRGGMDHDIGLDLLEDRDHGIERSDVAVEVLDAIGFGTAVACCAEVHHGHLAGVALDQLVDNVVTEEAAAANDDNVSKVFLNDFSYRRHCSRFRWLMRLQWVVEAIARWC